MFYPEVIHLANDFAGLIKISVKILYIKILFKICEDSVLGVQGRIRYF